MIYLIILIIHSKLLINYKYYWTIVINANYLIIVKNVKKLTVLYIIILNVIYVNKIHILLIMENIKNKNL